MCVCVCVCACVWTTILALQTRVEGQMDGKLCSSGKGGTDGKYLPVCTYMYMCGSAHDCGCVVDGSSAMAAS